MDKRNIIQIAAALLQNLNLRGFLSGGIYKGRLKGVCVPGLNCYSCPSALGACPVGAFQSAVTARHGRFPAYVLGLLVLFGAVLGRAVCGFLCPFGLVQGALYRLPVPGKRRTLPGDRALRYLKYLVLALLVVGLPMAVKNTPFFCKYLCPAGTLGGGIPLMLADGRLNSQAGALFWWKVGVLAAVLLLCLFVYRPFCRYLCPLGAFYGLFNRLSLYRMQLDRDKCTGCGVCAGACKMGVSPQRSPNSCECIRCGDCTRACPAGALKLNMGHTKPKKQNRQIKTPGS